MRHDIDPFQRYLCVGLSYQASLNQRILLQRARRLAGIGGSL
jgi:hypothetical protein